MMSRGGHHVKKGDLVWFWLEYGRSPMSSANLDGPNLRWKGNGIVLSVWDSNVYEPSEVEVLTTLPGAKKQTLLLRTRDVYLVEGDIGEEEV